MLGDKGTTSRVGSPLAPQISSSTTRLCPPWQAIDHTVKALCREYNTGAAGAVVFNTYQAYLRDSRARLVEDMERARREGYAFAAKLVGGSRGCECRGWEWAADRAEARQAFNVKIVHRSCVLSHPIQTPKQAACLSAVFGALARVLVATSPLCFSSPTPNPCLACTRRCVAPTSTSSGGERSSAATPAPSGIRCSRRTTTLMPVWQMCWMRWAPG